MIIESVSFFVFFSKDKLWISINFGLFIIQYLDPTLNQLTTKNPFLQIWNPKISLQALCKFKISMAKLFMIKVHIIMSSARDLEALKHGFHQS